MTTGRPRRCPVAWAPHACSLPPHETGQHLCACCSREHAREHAQADEDAYGYDGCAGTWPYYGRAVMTDPAYRALWFTNYYGYEKMPHEFDRLAAQPREIPTP